MKTTSHTSPALLRKLEQARYYPAFLTLVSVTCFWLAWPPNRCAPLLFVAFVPLLLMEYHVSTHNYKRPYRSFFLYAYLTIFLWNLTTTWWVACVTVPGAIFMLLVNTLCMCLPLPIFQWTTKYEGRLVGCASLVSYWVTMEYLHCYWQFSFPWLVLGNGLAHFPEWVQWYEYTGTLGGTVWILAANVCFFQALCASKSGILQRKAWGGLAAVCVLLPILVSYPHYVYYQEKGEEVEVVVIQPNINPITADIPSTQARIDRFIELSETQLTKQTQLLVWPEAALDPTFNEEELRDYLAIDRLIKFRQQYPDLSLLLGITSRVSYDSKVTKTTRFSDRHGYYDVFYSALFIGNQGVLDTYHKSKLVPGAEFIPYLYSIKLPACLTSGMGGTLRSMGMQDHPSIFCNTKGTNIAPVICYESIYSAYLAEFVRRGASLFCAIKMMGWWGDTPGYQQGFHYARLRAIETRRSMAHSALQGISGFINQRGDVLQATQRYDDQAAFRHTLRANTKLTLYVKYSNFIPCLALCLAFSFIVLVIVGIKVKAKLKIIEAEIKAAKEAEEAKGKDDADRSV